MNLDRSSSASRLGAPLLSVAAVADQLGVSTKTVRRWIDDGRLIPHRIGRTLRIAPEDLRLFLSQHRG